MTQLNKNRIQVRRLRVGLLRILDNAAINSPRTRDSRETGAEKQDKESIKLKDLQLQ